ncbi:MAG: hypothetical protein MJ088_05790 [Clostridia bacterium]|nr:hypothetical protein [Clostridia bacterium]
MKKAYTKPGIVFDNFELSQSIAGSCKAISNQAWQMCLLVISEPGIDLTVFQNDVVCKDAYHPGPGEFNDLCYDVPTPDANVFSS